MSVNTRATLQPFHYVRMVVIGILAVSYMSVFFHRVAPAVVAGELMQTFATTGASLGMLAAMYFYVYTAMQIPAGILADTVGVRIAAGTGALVAGIGSIIFALAPDFLTASIGRFLVGLGVSVVFVGLMRANTVWWSESRNGSVGGFTLMLGISGAILAAFPLASLLTVITWRTVFVIAGGFSIFMAALTFAFVRNRPEDAGLPPLRPSTDTPKHRVRSQHWWRNLADVLRNREVWPGFWVTLGMNGSLAAFVGLWGVPLLRDVHRLSRAEASLYTSVTLAALALGSLTLGALSDRLQRRKPVLVASAICSSLVWLAFLVLPWEAGASGFLLYALLGFCAGGFVTAFSTAKEVVAPATAGMAIGVVNTGLFLGAAIIQPSFGALMDLTWTGTMLKGVRIYRFADYANGMWLCFGLTAMSAVASLRLRETYCRNVTGLDRRKPAEVQPRASLDEEFGMVGRKAEAK